MDAVGIPLEALYQGHKVQFFFCNIIYNQLRNYKMANIKLKRINKMKLTREEIKRIKKNIMEFTNPDKVSNECKHKNTAYCDRVLTCRDCGEELENVISHENQFSRTVVLRENYAQQQKYNDTKKHNFKSYISTVQGRYIGNYKELIEKVKQKLEVSKKNQIEKAEKRVEEAKEKLREAQRVTKADVLSVLKSDFKKDRGNIHWIYSEITAEGLLDFSDDERDLKLDFEDVLKFYTQNKEKRSVFSEKYALYYLLVRKGYPVSLKKIFPILNTVKKNAKSLRRVLQPKKLSLTSCES